MMSVEYGPLLSPAALQPRLPAGTRDGATQFAAKGRSDIGRGATGELHAVSAELAAFRRYGVKIHSSLVSEQDTMMLTRVGAA